MVTIQAKGKVYGVKHFVVDVKDDLNLIRRDLLYMGSTAYIIATGEKYIVDGNRNWVLMPQIGDSSGDSGGDDDPIIDTIIYDGGEVLG